MYLCTCEHNCMQRAHTHTTHEKKIVWIWFKYDPNKLTILKKSYETLENVNAEQIFNIKVLSATFKS